VFRSVKTSTRFLIAAAAALSLVTCAPAAPPDATIEHPQYRYVPTYPTGPLSPGDSFHVVWTPHLVRLDPADPYEIRLCVGLYGSFADPGALKETMARSSITRPDCPPNGAVVSSGVLQTRSDSGTPLSADLVLPRATGFYDVRQIEISGVAPTYSVTASSGVIEIRAVAAPSPSETLYLPDEFAANVSYVSPDGRFVAARARDWSRVVLYRIERSAARPTLPDLISVAEVRGFVDLISWLEDSSAVLVDSDLDATHSVSKHDPSGEHRRVAILNIDGHVVVAPAQAREALHHRAHASPDGRWIPVSECCGRILVLSRDGGEVREVVHAGPGVFVLFTGWDRDGLLLSTEIAEHSTLVAVDVAGVEQYRVAAPRDFAAVQWGIVAIAPDRSWQLIDLNGGMGSSFHARRLLVGRSISALPEELDASPYGPLVLGSELVYMDRTGALRAFDPSSARVRDLPVRLDLSHSPAIAGISDGFLSWMELTRGYVADLATGRAAALPLQRNLNVSIVDGARLADYHSDDNAIVILNLPAFAKP
jgi:hypothetical protein